MLQLSPETIAPLRTAAIALALVVSAPVSAQPAGPQTPPLDLRLDWTQFVSSAVAGSGDFAPRYGGRADVYADIDGEGIGLWNGLTIKAQGEFVYGRSVNRVGSRVLLPVNTALNFPSNDSEDFDLSVNIVQRIGRVRIQAGKINMLDQSTAIPIVGGGGKEGFQHIGIASPPALIASPKILGALVSVPVGKVVLTGGVWAPDDWTKQFGPGRFFSDGVDGMAVVLIPAKIGGKQGFHNFSVFVTSRQRRSADDFPDITLPPILDNVPVPKRGGAYFKYGVQQYLWQDPADRKRGFGLFGHVGVSQGTPEILSWSMTAGAAGSVPFASRPSDTVGLGYFRLALNNKFIRTVEPLLPLKDEQGVEFYYTAQLIPAIRLTGNIQVVDSAFANAPTALYAGIRAKTSF
ncbi:carbohydrate porin [Sandaracinobacteroides hominis]|uniref:carbohydrate porin n=1 Tax=Sandaracinobacteroides hominis TaxID=2780086 RepID=UPI0018F53A02|nr:carbohydrate porin [Sandaracinobacteroides hominis]